MGPLPNLNLENIDWAKKCEELGAGELLITSIDKEGTGLGTDLNLNLKIVKEVSVPVIISGGIGNYEHLKKLKSSIDLDAVAIAKVLHYNLIEIKEAKKILI